MPTAIVTVDEQLGEARAEMERISSELQAKSDAAAIARAELDQLGREEPDARSARDTPAVTRWIRAHEAARRRLEQALGGVQDLERRRLEQQRFVAQLEAQRIPEIDDALLDARRRLEANMAARQRAAADLHDLEERQARFDVSAALGELLPAGEPAAIAQAIVEAQRALADLGAEQVRLQALAGALLERRAAEASTRATSSREALRERWAELADDALAAALRLQAVGAELEALDDEHRAIGARDGQAPSTVPTVGDLRWAPHELEQLVARARGLQLRGARSRG